MKKKIIKIISSISIIMIILSSIPVFASELQTATDWESKISDELLEIMDTKSNTELIPVYIWLNDIDHEIIRKAMIDEKGMNPAIYENDELFKKEIVPEIEAKIVERVGYEKAHEKVENSAYVLDSNGAYHDDTMSLVDRAIQAKINEYIMAKRSISKREHSAFVNEFVEEHVNEDRKLISVGEYVTYIIVESTKEEIKEYALLQEVEDISLFVNHEITTDMSIPLDQVDAGYSGTKGTSYNNGNGLKGTGIKVGVLEVGLLDATCPHLAPIVNTRVFIKNDSGTNDSEISTSINDHASVVTSIIVGQPVTIDQSTYEGVVPLSTVYQTPVNNELNLQNALENMVDRGVTVINMSLGIISDGTYTSLEKQIDSLIFETGITCIKSAGNNEENVSSPGKAFNIITVGNLETINSSFTSNSAPYNICDSSSFEESTYLPNKPDIVAPGTRIRVVKSISGTEKFYYNNGLLSTGTSFSAPIVTGIVAQIQQAAGGMFYYFPALTKSVLATTADPMAIITATSSVPDTSNTTDGIFLWEKSGAGLVNAKKSVDLSLSSQWQMEVFSAENQTYTSYNKYFTAGDHVRATLTFEKEHNTDITLISTMDNLNFFLLDSNGNSVFSNTSYFDNVIIIDYEITTSGYYCFKVTNPELVLETGIAFYYSWKIE